MIRGIERQWRHVFALVILWALLLCVGKAQQATGDIVGTISDPSGAVVPGAKVKAVSVSTGETRSVVSDGQGNYVISALKPGHYSITASATGFKSWEISDMLIAAGDRARLDATLTTGEATETVQVVASTTPLLQSDSSTVGTALAEESVQDLPLNGRNFVQLAQLTMGANEGSQNGLSSGARPDDRRQSASISVNGQSDVLNNYMIDGADNNERIIGTIGIRPSVEAISEIHVQTNVYSAEVGRTSGAVIDIITKSGGNMLHGSVYEYFRNDVLDASNYDFGAHLRKNELRQNQFGGSLGGPIRKNQTFFFGDYEGYRQVAGKTQSAYTPTLAQESNPLADKALQDAGIFALDPVAKNFLALYPKPLSVTKSQIASSSPYYGDDVVGIYTGTQNRTQFSNLFDIRLDNAFSPSNLFFTRFSYNNVSTFTPDVFPTTTVAGLAISPGGNFNNFAGPAVDKALNLQLNYTHIFSQNLLLNLVASYLRINNSSDFLNSGSNASEKIGLHNISLGTADTSGLTQVLINGYGTLGDSFFLPLRDIDNNYQVGGTLTWTHGRQNIKSGVSLIRRLALNDQNNYGTGWVLSVFGNLNPTLPAQMASQSNLATFLSGLGELEFRSNQLTGASHYRMWESGYFLQDDIKVSKRLTLNAGVRYDIITPFSEAHNQIANFDSVLNAMVVASASHPTAGVKTQYGNVAPRVGFVVDLGKGMVVRGGFGISYFPSNYTAYASLKNQPFVSTFTGVFGPLDGFPKPSNPTLDTNGVPKDGSSIRSSLPPDYKLGSLQQYNLLIQKQFGANVFTIGYVGMGGRHLGQPLNSINVVAPGQGVEHEPYVPASCPNHVASSTCNIGSIGQMGDGGKSSYSSLQTAFQRRFTNGLAVDLNYTWAHGLADVNDVSDEPNKTAGAALAVKNQYPRYDWGNSDQDIRSRIAANMVYELPFGKSLTGAKALVTKGWQANLLTVWQTGNPFSVRNGSVVAGTEPGAPGDAYDRPNQIGSATISNPGPAAWFNPKAFAVQTAGTLGSERLNQLYGPHFTHFDLGLSKDFQLPRKETYVQFRIESFNLFNHTNQGLPDNVVTDATLGQISNTNANYTPRELQFALKLQF